MAKRGMWKGSLLSLGTGAKTFDAVNLSSSLSFWSWLGVRRLPDTSHLVANIWNKLLETEEVKRRMEG